MPDLVMYNNPGIEGHIAAMQSLNAHGQDQAQQMMQLYQTLDSVASGQATNAGMEFAAQSHQIRQNAADLTQQVCQAGLTATSDMNMMDGSFMGIMG